MKDLSFATELFSAAMKDLRAHSPTQPPFSGSTVRLQGSKKGEPIDKLLHGGYSTLSLGYAGLWECVYEITGKKLTEKEGEEFGLRVMQRLNDACAEWKAAENIDYSIYGTPLESTTYKFAKCLQNRFGIIKGVTDRNYITNSYHIHVTEKIDAFSKLELESKFQKLSPGGAISYVEVPNMQQNIPAVLEVMKFIYNNIMYAELNTKSDYCQVCGYDGEIQIVEEDGKLVWRCPNCGNEDQSKMNVARRTCGYIGSQFWNQGRTQGNKRKSASSVMNYGAIKKCDIANGVGVRTVLLYRAAHTTARAASNPKRGTSITAKSTQRRPRMK